MNKTISIVINAVLVVAVIVLFVLVLNKKDAKSSVEEVREKVQTGEILPVAYINVDSLLLQYQFAVDANEALMRKQEDARLKINTQARKLQADMEEFQRKLENNGFLSEARAIDARDQLLVKSENFRRLQEDMIAETAREQNELNKQLFDKLTNFLKEYNKEKGFDIVLSTQLGGNVLFAVDGFDITNDVVNRLNEEYKKEKGK